MATEGQLRDWKNHKIEDIVKSNEKISTAQMERDLTATEIEIEQLKQKIEHLKITPRNDLNYRVNMLKLDNAQSGIRARENFVEMVKAILKYRKEHAS